MAADATRQVRTTVLSVMALHAGVDLRCVRWTNRGKRLVHGGWSSPHSMSAAQALHMIPAPAARRTKRTAHVAAAWGWGGYAVRLTRCYAVAGMWSSTWSTTEGQHLGCEQAAG